MYEGVLKYVRVARGFKMCQNGFPSQGASDAEVCLYDDVILTLRPPLTSFAKLFRPANEISAWRRNQDDTTWFKT